MKNKSAQTLNAKINRTSRYGFTLVEIIIVMAIIAVLSAAFITMLNPAKQFARARDSQRRSDITIISVALEQYYADNNQYPDAQDINELENILTGATGGDKYVKEFPHDPSEPDQSYCYDRDPNNTGSLQDFLLCSTLEAADEDEIPSNFVSLKGNTTCMPDADSYYHCVTSQ